MKEVALGGGWNPFRYIEPPVILLPLAGVGASTATLPATTTMTPNMVAAQLASLGIIPEVISIPIPKPISVPITKPVPFTAPSPDAVPSPIETPEVSVAVRELTEQIIKLAGQLREDMLAEGAALPSISMASQQLIQSQLQSITDTALQTQVQQALQAQIISLAPLLTPTPVSAPVPGLIPLLAPPLVPWLEQEGWLGEEEKRPR
ncbi:unnamed protein product, partial [marine sediment metagenome]